MNFTVRLKSLHSETVYLGVPQMSGCLRMKSAGCLPYLTCKRCVRHRVPISGHSCPSAPTDSPSVSGFPPTTPIHKRFSRKTSSPPTGSQISTRLDDDRTLILDPSLTSRPRRPSRIPLPEKHWHRGAIPYSPFIRKTDRLACLSPLHPPENAKNPLPMTHAPFCSVESRKQMPFRQIDDKSGCLATY